MNRVKIVVDAMGGDHAPEVVVAGAIAEARAHGTQIILVGIEDRIRAELSKQGGRQACPSRSCTPPRSWRWRSTRWR